MLDSKYVWFPEAMTSDNNRIHRDKRNGREFRPGEPLPPLGLLSRPTVAPIEPRFFIARRDLPSDKVMTTHLTQISVIGQPGQVSEINLTQH